MYLPLDKQRGGQGMKDGGAEAVIEPSNDSSWALTHTRATIGSEARACYPWW